MKLHILIATIINTALLAPALALAQFSPPSESLTGLENTNIILLIRALMLWVLAIVGFIAIISFAVAGLMYLTAAGNEDRIAAAKRTMISAIVGVIVALGGLAFVNAAQNFLGGSTRF